jgi:hypothetical protein
MSFVITAKCENGHEQTLTYFSPFEGLTPDADRFWAETQVGLLDGTSSMYKYSPIGTDSVIGKCGICKAQIKCTVEERFVHQGEDPASGDEK